MIGVAVGEERGGRARGDVARVLVAEEQVDGVIVAMEARRAVEAHRAIEAEREPRGPRPSGGAAATSKLESSCRAESPR